MFEALVITLREGVEAALVIAIAASVLERRGLARLKGALYAGAVVALAASVGAAAFATRFTYNEELAEGIAMLVGAVLVATLVFWMWKAAPHFKQEIESGIARATGSGEAQAGANAGGSSGLFLFAFGMVFREGVETAIFLSAAGFNSQGLGRWIGAAVGLLLAIVFGWLFTRGSLKIPLKPFFSLTSAVLALIAIQLFIGGLHELSEAEVLPSSRMEMALIGPVVKNELLLFTLTVALAVAWLFFGPARRRAPDLGSGPEARIARAAYARESARRRWTAAIGLVIVAFLTTAFVQQSRLPERAAATPIVMDNGHARFDAATVHDGHLHFFETTVAGAPVRFFAIEVAGDVKTCFDACEICGDKGYFESGGAVVCRNCTSPIAVSSLGRTGGCNPIPLPHATDGGAIVIAAGDLEAALPRLKGR